MLISSGTTLGRSEAGGIDYAQITGFPGMHFAEVMHSIEAQMLNLSKSQPMLRPALTGVSRA